MESGTAEKPDCSRFINGEFDTMLLKEADLLVSTTDIGGVYVVKNNDDPERIFLRHISNITNAGAWDCRRYISRAVSLGELVVYQAVPFQKLAQPTKR